MDAATRSFVRQRAENRCEYCLLSQEHSELTHHIEHIIAKQHGGSDEVDNLALACHRCNLRKGPNVTGIELPAEQRQLIVDRFRKLGLGDVVLSDDVGNVILRLN